MKLISKMKNSTTRLCFAIRFLIRQKMYYHSQIQLIKVRNAFSPAVLTIQLHTE